VKQTLSLPITTEGPELVGLRHQVRTFVDGEIESGGFSPAVDAWLTGWDSGFSRRLANRGWLGMTIPAEYGGHGASFLERFVVVEELLAAGAPVAAHWIADRQIAPSLLKFGTEQQKSEFLPLITNAEVFFGIGMSEPGSGSDLASVRTKGIRAPDGWLLSGSKVWTTGAHAADFFIVLARTDKADPQNRRAGLSQFIVDLRAPGVEVRPILSMDGRHHFNEVFLDDVFVPDHRLFGTIGAGWQQVTSELSYERSGPERFLSTLPLLVELGHAVRESATQAAPELGRLVARASALHHLSLSVAGALSRNDDPANSAAIVKILGTQMEGDIAEYAALFLGEQDRGPRSARLRGTTEDGLMQRAGFTIRGGTNEILRGVLARGLGLR
jgi:alkylation response protein AidB-like acyl-CoA dehydrogenase